MRYLYCEIYEPCNNLVISRLRALSEGERKMSVSPQTSYRLPAQLDSF
jgi:hypothetical protein